MSDEISSAEFWEAHYAGLDSGWSASPTVALQRVVDAVAMVPGVALDIGSGHGSDALWLAGLGWQVTAIDVSETAIARTRARALTAGLSQKVSPRVADVTVDLPAGPFDLVTACYFHTPLTIDRGSVIHQLGDRIAPGGLLVVVDHASVAPWSWNQDTHAFPAPEETLETFALGGGWDPVDVAVSARSATGPNGEQADVLDNVIAVRRSI